MKAIAYIITTILASFYLFPFEFVYWPGVNTKMMLAVVGAPLFGFSLIRKQQIQFDSGFVRIVLWSLLVSLAGLTSVILNNTRDYTYANYITSMIVWMSAAYAVVYTIYFVHGKLTFTLICDYLIAVCVGQCASALLIEYVASFKAFVDSFALGVGFAFDFHDIQGARLYGIGAMLDVAGQRFSCVLVMIAYLLMNLKWTASQWRIILYVLSFTFISVVGNIIGRTTTIGLSLAVAYCFFAVFKTDKKLFKTLLKYLLLVVAISVFVVIFYYDRSEAFRAQFRFGFEGFVNLFEKGRWETHSNNILVHMYRVPDTLRTWLIGDGYFDNPTSDPYYIGYLWKGFYQGTDIGYLRFIFYFGLTGLFLFIGYFLSVARYCCTLFPKRKMFFDMLLLILFVVWCKVSSDIFSIFAIFFIGKDLLSDESDSETNVLEHSAATATD